MVGGSTREPVRPFTVTSLDGRRAVLFSRLSNIQSYGGGDTLQWEGRVEPDGDPIILNVAVDHFFTSPEFAHQSRGLSSSGPEKTAQLTALAAGLYLDDPENGIAVEPRQELPMGSVRGAWNVLQDAPVASVDQALLYLGAKVYWSWLYGARTARLGAVDALRLGRRGAEQVWRLAMAGEGAFWTKIDSPTSPGLYSPTGRLIREFRSGIFPGLVRTPIAQIAGLLEAPRYSAARVAFEKSAEFLAGDHQDLENAVKEAASGVESMGRIALGLTGKVTLGNVVSKIRELHIFDPALGKALLALDALSGFRGGEPGVGHGGDKEPHVTPEEAQFAVNIAASAALLLLDLDRR